MARVLSSVEFNAVQWTFEASSLPSPFESDSEEVHCALFLDCDILDRAEPRFHSRVEGCSVTGSS